MFSVVQPVALQWPCAVRSTAHVGTYRRLTSLASLITFSGLYKGQRLRIRWKKRLGTNNKRWPNALRQSIPVRVVCLHDTVALSCVNPEATNMLICTASILSILSFLADLPFPPSQSQIPHSAVGGFVLTVFLTSLHSALALDS